MQLADRIAIVTGGGRGIGRAIALAFAREGADIVATARTASEIEAVAEEIRALGRRALAVPCDVSDEAQVQHMVEAATKEFGRIDILVNNAGISPRGSIRDMSIRDWDQIMNVNFRGAYLCSRAVMEVMIKQRWGRILNIGSYRGVMPGASENAYGPAKAAMLNLTRLLAAHLAEYNIGVNLLIPGGVQTRINTNPKAKKPEEIVPAALFIVTQEPWVMSGQVVTLLQYTGQRPMRGDGRPGSATP